MKILLKYGVALLIGVVLFFLTMTIVGFGKIFDALFLFLSFKGLIILLISLLATWMSIIKWRFVMEKVNGKREFKGLAKIWYAGFTMTFLLTPMAAFGGEPFRVYFIKKKYNLGLKKSIASVLIERVFDWTLFLIFTLAGLFTILFFGGFPSKKMGWLIISIIGGLFLLLLLFYFRSLKKESTLGGILKFFGFKKENLSNSKNGTANLIFETEKELINFMSLKKKIFWQGLGLTFLKYTLFFLRVVVLVFFLGGGTNLLQSLLLYSFNNLGSAFPTPAALGSLEATSVLSFNIVGLRAATGTVFAMVLRGADIVISLIGLVFLFKLTFSITGTKILNYIDKLKG
jgi:uncharacterized protein (TIRG00374 family)